MYQVGCNPGGVGGIVFLGSLALWKFLPRDPFCQNVITNPPTENSTLGVSECNSVDSITLIL